VADRVDNGIDPLFWFWGSDDGFFIIHSGGLDMRQRWGTLSGLGVCWHIEWAVRFLGASSRDMPLLFAEEALSFYHESLLLFLS
jgi:hypothetical protein